MHEQNCWAAVDPQDSEHPYLHTEPLQAVSSSTCQEVCLEGKICHRMHLTYAAKRCLRSHDHYFYWLASCLQRRLSISRTNNSDADMDFRTNGAHNSLSADASPRWRAQVSHAPGRHSLDNGNMQNSDMYLPEASFRDGLAPIFGSSSNIPNGHPS